MKLRNYRETKQPDLNIIPMIDIMFFLLVFFMLSTMYMVEQKTIPVNLPQATSATIDNKTNFTVTLKAVSYTHLDVYKRQLETRPFRFFTSLLIELIWGSSANLDNATILSFSTISHNTSSIEIFILIILTGFSSKSNRVPVASTTQMCIRDRLHLVYLFHNLLILLVYRHLPILNMH